MCPICLTSLAVTVATTAGAGGGVTAIALCLRRSLTRDREHEIRKTRKDPHEAVEARRQP